MGKHSADVDAYIERAQPFARPILKKLRTLFHRACPTVKETIKWGVPCFDHEGMLGGMAAFKSHVGWGLWKAKLIKDPQGVVLSDASSTMGTGKFASVKDLPADDVIVGLIKQAVDLNERGVKTPDRGTKVNRTVPQTPPDLSAALRKNARARKTYDSFSPSCKREYVEWIAEAKQAATRQRRLTQAIEWMAAGRSRNWKYQKR